MQRTRFDHQCIGHSTETVCRTALQHSARCATVHCHLNPARCTSSRLHKSHATPQRLPIIAAAGRRNCCREQNAPLAIVVASLEGCILCQGLNQGLREGKGKVDSLSGHTGTTDRSLHRTHTKCRMALNSLPGGPSQPITGPASPSKHNSPGTRLL